MFGAPPTLNTEVFAALPVEFRQAGKLSQERNQAGKGTLKTDSFIEGPSFDQFRNLYIVDIAFGGINQQDLYITESETGSVLIAHLPSPV
ncbi:MAG: hypothetical protein K9J38_01350 [Polynucleobacter sp.]|nr:hypothetical protein [Polynucleobacter sp.]